MPWTDHVVRPFQSVPVNPRRADFHGPYNKLLNTLFPPDSEYTVVPQFIPGREGSDTFSLEVSFECETIFILALRSPKDLRYGSKRQDADLDIRRRMEDLRPYCSMPILHAVSAFGTQIRFYSIDGSQHVRPPLLATHPQSVTGAAPQECWDYDILEEQGIEKLKTIVEEIQHTCQFSDKCLSQ